MGDKEVIKSNKATPQTILAVINMLKENESSITFEEREKYLKQLKQMSLEGSKQQRIQRFVISDIMANLSFLRVTSMSPDSSKHIYYKNKGDKAYRPLDNLSSLEVVRDMYLENGFPGDIRDWERTVDTLKAMAHPKIDRIQNRIIKVGFNTYWDSKDCTLHPLYLGDEDEVCMRQLFDFDPADNIRVNIDEVSVMQDDIDNAYAFLQENNGLLRPDFNECLKPFWVWANEDLDTFNDLLKATASIFFYNKPKGAYFLIGETRNGKSSYITMLHTLLGSRNTSKVTSAELEDKHVNGALNGTMLNAPDEEKEGMGREVERSKAIFKSMSSHDPVTIGVMYKGAEGAMKVSTDFMCFYPMNRMPEWKGDGVQALVQRTLPIFFRNDLSRMDTGGRNFEKETYTAPYFCDLVPILLAICKFYNGKKLTFSETMAINRDTVRELLDAYTDFINSLQKYFHAVYNHKFLKNEFRRWCDEKGFEFNEGVASTLIEKLKRRCTLVSMRFSSGLDGQQKRLKGLCFERNAKNRPEHRIKVFGPDAIIAALGDRTPIEYLQNENAKGNTLRSIVCMFDDMVDNGDNPITMQEKREDENFMSHREYKPIARGTITDDGRIQELF